MIWRPSPPPSRSGPHSLKIWRQGLPTTYTRATRLTFPLSLVCLLPTPLCAAASPAPPLPFVMCPSHAPHWSSAPASWVGGVAPFITGHSEIYLGGRRSGRCNLEPRQEGGAEGTEGREDAMLLNYGERDPGSEDLPYYLQQPGRTCSRRPLDRGDPGTKAPRPKT